MQLRVVAFGICAVALAGCSWSGDVASGDAAPRVRSTTESSGPTSATDDSTPASTTDSVPAPSSTAASTTQPVPAPTIEWFQCGDQLDCATVEAPLDYDNPSAGVVHLNVVRHNAAKPSERIGSLLVNPGGPGFGGTYLASSATSIYSESILDHFDIVAWDPRGTGNSQPSIDCIDEFDSFFSPDVTPEDAAEQQALVDAAVAFREACKERNGDALGHISTVDTARDMDLLRRALDEDLISYFGFSYGSELGTVWASMFPETVRAAVFDGALDAGENAIQSAMEQAKGFELALNAFFATCGGCDFAQGGDPAVAFDQIMADIDANAYPTREGRPALTSTIAYLGVIEALYSQFSWPELAGALDEARRGQGSGLLDLYDAYYQREFDGTYGNQLEAFMAISCLDDPGPQSFEDVDAFADDFLAIAPHLGPSFTHGYVCVGWPAAQPPVGDLTAVGAGPIIVIGTTNDPATPFESTSRLAHKLEEGVLVRVAGDGHLGYRQSECARDLVDRYLIDLEVPDGDVDCG